MNLSRAATHLPMALHGKTDGSFLIFSILFSATSLLLSGKIYVRMELNTPVVKAVICEMGSEKHIFAVSAT